MGRANQKWSWERTDSGTLSTGGRQFAGGWKIIGVGKTYCTGVPEVGMTSCSPAAALIGVSKPGTKVTPAVAAAAAMSSVGIGVAVPAIAGDAVALATAADGGWTAVGRQAASSVAARPTSPIETLRRRSERLMARSEYWKSQG